MKTVRIVGPSEYLSQILAGMGSDSESSGPGPGHFSANDIFPEVILPSDFGGVLICARRNAQVADHGESGDWGKVSPAKKNSRQQKLPPKTMHRIVQRDRIWLR